MRPGRCQLNKIDTRPKVRKQAWERDRDHLAFIRQLPCCVCGRTPCDAAHVRTGTDGAMARKPSDRHVVPLCNGDWFAPAPQGCHQTQHIFGEQSFWDDHADPLDLAAKLWSLSRKYEGEKLIEMGRYAIEEWKRR